MTSGALVQTRACTAAAPSSAALAATMAAKSASSLAGPPAYVAGASRGSVIAQTIDGLASGVKSASDAAVTPVAGTLVPLAAALVMAAGAGAGATLTAPVMWKKAAAALALMLGWRTESTAR